MSGGVRCSENVPAGEAFGKARRSPLAVVGEWVRHHAGAMIASGVDFLVMIAVVELGHANPVLATAVGAIMGALTSFLLGRTWVFHREDGAATGQALRYVLVAGTSLALNAGGELLLLRAGLGYVRARVLVAILVSNLWNYPMHKFFVFGRRPRGVEQA